MTKDDINEPINKKSCPNCFSKKCYDGRTGICNFCGYEKGKNEGVKKYSEDTGEMRMNDS